MHWGLIGLAICAAFLLSASSAPATRPASEDPIRQMLWGRTDEFGASYPYFVDAPIYPGSSYLIQGPSHDRIMSLLDGLLAQPVNDLAANPRRRAVMQSELWQVFDYTIDEARGDQSARIDLRKKLVAAIRKLAMSKEQIQALPDNLAATEGGNAPPHVDDAHAGWLEISMADDLPAGRLHEQSAGGRSVFGVYMRLPGGPDATAAYLRRLGRRAAATQPTHDPLPQFPAGTQLALVRRMMLIDSAGQPVSSPIVQSVQVRTFVKVKDLWPAKHADVRMEEFVLDADRYAAGQGGAVHAIEAFEYQPPDQFEHPAISPFDYPSNLPPPPMTFRLTHPLLAECFICHSSPGVNSMRSLDSLTAFMRKPYSDTIDKEVQKTIAAKRTDVSWGLLRGYWESLPH